MKKQPLKGDWIELLIKDLTKVNLTLENEEEIKSMTHEQFKTKIKIEIRKHAFNEIEAIKSTHKKFRDINHNDMKNPQGYIKDNKFTNKMCSVLFDIRSRCVNEFKDNLHNLHETPLCPLCLKFQDSQEHAFSCAELPQQRTDPASISQIIATYLVTVTKNSK